MNISNHFVHSEQDNPVVTAVTETTSGVLSDQGISEKPNGEKTAAVITISENFNKKELLSVQKQIDRARDQGCRTIIFEFSGRGQSFTNFSQLAELIDDLATGEKIRTIAFVPDQAKGMSMLAVFACREIVAGKFAQLGQIADPDQAGKRTKTGSSGVDVQSLQVKAVGFALSAGHDPLIARAMTDKRMILYRIERQGQTKLVDQSGFEEHVQQTQQPWRMKGSGPLAGADQVLLLDGQQALEVGLIRNNTADLDELAEIFAVKLLKTKTDSRTDIASDEAADEELAEQKTSWDSRPDPNAPAKPPKAVVITIADMVDNGLYESLKRRTQAAIDAGATHIIYQVDTDGGLVSSARDIWYYFMHDVNLKVHTVAYVRSRALSAGAMISVACNDIIMKKATQIGDCAPITLGGQLEGVEREKIESALRKHFTDAAEINGYPAALCRAMVSIHLQVYRYKNLETDSWDYFDDDGNGENLPDGFPYDLESAELVVREGELCTLTADNALKYGISRTVVEGLDEQAIEKVFKFLEQRDQIKFSRPIAVLETNWSETMVRWIASPAVAGILMLVAMLGIYVELNSPGLGLPGAVALIALTILFGSKYLIGMANWWEIAFFIIGMGLLVLEIFVIPGFGIAGISGILLMVFSLGAMMVTNSPSEFPLPATELDWQNFEAHLLWTMAGFLGFIVCAYFFGKYFTRIPITNRLVLPAHDDPVSARSGGAAAPSAKLPVTVGQKGITLSSLRPSGNARFGNQKLPVVSRGNIIDANKEIVVVAIDGNSIVVKEIS
ncbi:MAG: hypothetical protein JXD22_06715 [Sedimentisphaerales bacterium]|nr:hypothetical protein [Sedimentisphaerales bacterium]